VFGNISNPLLRATMEAGQRSSGRAILVLTPRICRPARWRLRFAAPRRAPSLIHLRLLGRMSGGVVCPKSRGQIRLTGPNPDDPIQIEANTLSHPDDMKAAVACVELCREIGNSPVLQPFTKREVMPGNLRGAALEDFIRDAASTYHHQTCTSKMGRDSMSVVDGHLKVYGIENLRIADGSIMPRVTTGNTMAPCMIIAAQILREEHKL
jgi:choline dehydrogenase